MTAFIITIHIIACILLIALILIQRGRGAGLVESFSGVESMFGTKTNAFLTRTTTVLSILFFLTCLSLTVLSVKASRSLMKSIKHQTATAQEAQSVVPSALPEQVSQQSTKAEEKAAPTPTRETPKTE